MSHTAPDSDTRLISVVLCCHNGARTLPEQLAALAEQDYTGPWELVFVNDASTDDSVAIAESWQDRLPLRTVSTNGGGRPVGLSSAKNVGGNAARGEVLLFCDDDDVADPMWISALVDATREAAAAGGILSDELLNEPRVRAWRFAATPGQLQVAFKTLPFAPSGNCGIRTAVFRELGGFNDELAEFCCGEEVDFFIRLQLAGYELRYAPNAIMHYRHRDSLRHLARQWYRYGRVTTINYAHFRGRMALPRTTAGETVRFAWAVVPHVVDLVRGNERRGRWIRLASFLAGEAVESVRLRVWHIG